MNLCFVVLNEMLTGVVPSQVLAPARAFSNLAPNQRTQVVFFEAARVAFSARSRARFAELKQFWPEGTIRLCPYIGRLGLKASAFTLAAVARRWAWQYKPLVFHCRGPAATELAVLANRRLGGRVLFDMRGASEHETELRLRLHNSKISQNDLAAAVAQALAIDQRAALGADVISAVTEPLRRYGIGLINGGEKPSATVPCCIGSTLYSDPDRHRIRASLGLANDEALLVSVSTEARWEAWNDIAAFFRAFERRRPARLLFLTTLPEAVVLSGFPPDDPLRKKVLLHRAAPAEVGRYLSAADIGLLLRRPHPTHAYACPIKFAEYLGAGLAVVVSAGIGSTETLVSEAKLGIVVPPEPIESDLAKAAASLAGFWKPGSSEFRDRAIEFCKRHYFWERHAKTLKLLYGIE